MKRTLKVFGCSLYDGRREIVAATSKKEAARLADVSMYWFNDYYCETYNEKEVAFALSHPQKVCREKERHTGEFLVVEEQFD